MPRALSPELFWQMAQYNIVDAGVIVAMLYFGIVGRLKLQSYYAQPLTIMTSAVLVALAATSEFTYWLQYLPVLAAAVMPVLAAHPEGYIVFQLANMLGIYQALSNQSYVLMVAQVLSRVISMLSTLDQPKVNFISSMLSTFTFANERNLLKKSNITLEDIPQHPEWLVTATSKEIIVNPNQPYFVIQTIIRTVWNPLVPLYIIRFLINLSNVAKVYMHGQVLRSLDSTTIPLYHGACSLLMWAFLSYISHAERQINDYISLIWENLIHSIAAQIKQQVSKAGYQQSRSSLDNIEYNVRELGNDLDSFVGSVHILLITSITLCSVYQHIGYLVIVPFVIDIAFNLSSYIICAYILQHVPNSASNSTLYTINYVKICTRILGLSNYLVGNKHT